MLLSEVERRSENDFRLSCTARVPLVLPGPVAQLQAAQCLRPAACQAESGLLLFPLRQAAQLTVIPRM